MARGRRIDRIRSDALRTTARQLLSAVVVPIAAARRALAGRPLHSKRAVQKPRSKSYGACIILRAKPPTIVIVRPGRTVATKEVNVFATSWANRGPRRIMQSF